MAKVNIEAEMLFNHTDEEIIEFLDSMMTGVLKNYRTAISANQPEILWGNLGDISLVASLIREMKKRNATRQAQQKAVQ